MSKGFRRPSNKLPKVKEKVKEDYPKKDLGMLLSLFRQTRKPSTDELFSQILGEFTIEQRLNHAFANRMGNSIPG